MVKIISILLTEKMLEHHIIVPEKQEIYKTGLMLILADVINFSLIVLIGLITQSLLFSGIFLLQFWTVRHFCGGFHAKTHEICRIVTVGTYVLILFLSSLIDAHWMLYTIVCNAVTFVTMVLFAPIRHPNKKLTDKEIQANKTLALITTSFYITISIILVAIGYKTGLFISLILSAITMLMYIGLFMNRKEGKK